MGELRKNEGAAVALVEALACDERGLVNRTLRELNVLGNHFSFSGIEALIAALTHNDTLETLCFLEAKDAEARMIDCNLHSEDAALIAAEVVEKSELTNLDLTRNLVMPQGLGALGEMLMPLPALAEGAYTSTLTSLVLSKNRVSWSEHQPEAEQENVEGLDVLAQSLLANCSLTLLDLSHNVIGCKGAAALAAGLKGNTRLVTLDLSHNSVGPDGGTAIALQLLPGCAPPPLAVPAGCSLAQRVEHSSGQAPVEQIAPPKDPSNQHRDHKSPPFNTTIQHLNLEHNHLVHCAHEAGAECEQRERIIQGVPDHLGNLDPLPAAFAPDSRGLCALAAALTPKKSWGMHMNLRHNYIAPRQAQDMAHIPKAAPLPRSRLGARLNGDWELMGVTHSFGVFKAPCSCWDDGQGRHFPVSDALIRAVDQWYTVVLPLSFVGREPEKKLEELEGVEGVSSLNLLSNPMGKEGAFYVLQAAPPWGNRLKVRTDVKLGIGASERPGTPPPNAASMESMADTPLYLEATPVPGDLKEDYSLPEGIGSAPFESEHSEVLEPSASMPDGFPLAWQTPT
ncbi:hypothetical protein CYMTET_15801 [Cymbomonas tetramitiformis]|uniref:Uncharacterized protein n=1 Tax=Cymbomonas tetramitiformis TaxID=36881 RepID=A0AAE0L8M0_9CHLO|nr:hypothetical protein CYMTET_15801 [Cymbomonas tetramitiformis]